MNNQPQQRIDENALKAWQLSGWISAGTYTVIFAVVAFLAYRFDWPTWIPAVVFIAAAAQSVLEIRILPRLHYNQWRYSVNEDEIELQHGIFIKKRTLIPMIRIQHVDTKQGPILRKYGLATVTFSTAAGSHEIPALSEHSADRVRRQIASLARISDEEI